MKTKQTIIKAMKALGYEHGRLHIDYGNGIATVELNGEYFGIYDFERDTFID